MKTLSPDLSQRKRILKTISHSHPQWKGRIILAGALILIALGIIGYTVVLLFNRPTTTFAYSSSFVLIFALHVSHSSLHCP